ncbi:MAG: glycosyltransferase family 2 protein [Bacteroidota bacterium]|nr:glycosyltransferase family 2 protein [Bacteroidota bacterium]
MTDISVIIPLFNEEESIPELVEWIHKVMHEHKFLYEIILVDDGSTDNSWSAIEKLYPKYPQIKAIRFNRNYGKSAALNEGFQACSGQVVITMDADLQDSPDEIPELFHMIKNEHFDLVSGWKQKRFDPLSKTIPTKLFNGVTRYMSGIQLHDFNCGLKAYRLKVVKSIEIYGEMHRYIPVIAKWSGFSRIGEKVVQHRARKYGTTKFGWERFLNGFLDLLSISFVTRFRRKPMHFFGGMGLISFLTGITITIWVLFEKQYQIYNHLKVRDVTQQPLFFLALVALIVGIQFFLAGYLGEMINVSSNKKQHEYLIAEKIGLS